MDRKSEANGKQRISDALCKLGESRPIEKVTVREIIAEAEINRSTFYYHFESVQDAMEWMISDFLEEYLQLLFDIPKEKNDVLVENYFLLEQEKNVCELIQRKKNCLALFFNRYNQADFRERFWQAFQKHARAYDLITVDPKGDTHIVKRGIAYDYCLRINFAIWFELLSCWHDRDFHETAEDFIKIFDIMYNGIIGFENCRA